MNSASIRIEPLQELLTSQETKALWLRSRGAALKVIAGELGVSMSTASRLLLKVRQRLGVSRHVLALPTRLDDLLETLERTCLLLSRAEAEVLRLVVAGHSNSEIARARLRSPRTIANQIGSMYQKLRVSGRAELMTLLAAPDKAAWTSGA